MKSNDNSLALGMVLGLTLGAIAGHPCGACAEESGATCALPEAPAAYLDLVSKERKISAVPGPPEYTKIYDLITKKNDIPNILGSCRMTPVEITGDDPITHQPRKVTVMSYAPQGSAVEKLRTIILMPPTGGENVLDDAYATHLCENDFRVVMVQHWAGDDIVELYDMDMHDRGTTRATAAVEDTIEYINPAKPAQLGILGTSVGAITSALMLGVDYRISAGTIILGGGGMPEIISVSTEATLTKLRAARLGNPSLGLRNVDDYRKALEEHVKIEPLHFVNFSQSKKILFFMALQDTTVPTANQRLLYHAFGDQELVTHDADHFDTIVYTNLTEKGRITEFFKGSLAEPTVAELAAHDRADGNEAGGNLLCRNARAPGAAPQTGP